MPALRPLQAAALALTSLTLVGPGLPGAVLAQQREPVAANTDSALTGPRSNLPKDWMGLRPLSRGVAILVMPGHADSQGSAAAPAVRRWHCGGPAHGRSDQR